MFSKETIAIERQRINDSIRSFFRVHGYIEVETPILVASPGMEPNLTPFETKVIEPNGSKHGLGLITSPEYAMKKLLGLGMKKIFTLTKVFRNNEELGGQHNPEFTMLEWYNQGSDYNACMDETEALIKFLGYQGNFQRKSVKELFDQVNVNLDGLQPTKDDTLSDVFHKIFLEKIEPNLGNDPVFVYDYPKYQAALSRLSPDGKFGERFELYINGLELCNGFTELTNADEQRNRFKEEAEERRLAGKTIFPIDEELLQLLPSIQNPTCGNALGVDRLHMVLTGRKSINDVLLFPTNYS